MKSKKILNIVIICVLMFFINIPSVLAKETVAIKYTTNSSNTQKQAASGTTIEIDVNDKIYFQKNGSITSLSIYENKKNAISLNANTEKDSNTNLNVTRRLHGCRGKYW